MKKIYLLLPILIYSFLAYSQSKSYNDVQSDFINKAELKNAAIGLYAKNIKTGEVIFDYNSEMSLVPASVFKIFPTSIALEMFGTEHNFKTELAYSGSINTEGTLNGNIYITGYGDPCLGSGNFSSHYNKEGEMLQVWAEKVKALGIKKINGNIIADISYFGEISIPNTWMWEDIANYYGNHGSALNYYDNLYHIHFSTGNTDGSKTVITKVVPENTGISFENYVKASSTTGDEAYIYLGADNTKRVVRGTLPWKSNNYAIKGSMPEPELFLSKSFTEKLKNNGIEVFGTQILISEITKQERKVFHTVYSPTLQKIVEETNVKSINLYSEVLGYHISKKAGKPYKDAVIDFLKLKNIDISGLNIADACGLSHFNTLTPKQMTCFLLCIKTSFNTKTSFLNSLPVLVISGSSLMNYKIHAKSGSMTRVRAYAGYITNQSNEKIAFCFIVNNYNCNSSQMRMLYEDFFKNTAEIKKSIIQQ
jgi:D-alanyl-D-alanine carboxypeptidase/D-alanyl-D-alanine-endopeptidase (penicillin-binding protein 4)